MKRNLLLMLGSLLVSAIFFEILLRVAGIEYTTFVVSDSDLGWSLRPGGQGWYRAEGKAFVHINSHGFRGPETPVEKPVGTFRVAVLGDSFTAALDVSDGAMVTSVLQRNLGSCKKYEGRKVEVLNFGVGGYGTGQELIQLRTRVLQFKPDLVLLLFFSSNDVFDNYRSLRESLREQAPYFVPDSTGKLVLDDGFRHSQRRKWLLDSGGTALYYSRFLQLCNQVRKVFAIPLTAVWGGTPSGSGKAADPYPPADVEKAFQVTESLLGMIQEECSQNGVRLAVGVIPAPYAASPDSAVAHGDLRSLAIDLRIEKINKKLGIPTTLLGEPLAKYATGKQEFLYGFPTTRLGTGHWNEKGHKVGGEILSRFLCDLSTNPPVASIVREK